MKFSFVLLTWNRYKFLEKCLEALIAGIDQPQDAEIVVMDNGSTDETPDVLQRYQNSQLVRVVTREKNYGLEAYKKLFALARGEYIVVVDDDVLQFPGSLDRIFADYMLAFPDYGFLGLNVVQNEFTNGAKPGPDQYVDDIRGEKAVERGPTGGWCACFRRSDYQKLWLRMRFSRLNMKHSEDGFLAVNLKKKLGLHSGIIRDAVCFHATGPEYARQYGHLGREIQKYAQSGLPSFVAAYEKYKRPSK
jgi:glycosyltransferase involved in cell wall biosynthesis